MIWFSTRVWSTAQGHRSANVAATVRRVSDEIPIRPAATVILARDGDRSVEVLLVRRAAELAFHGGSWVFPGGRVDPNDYAVCGADDIEGAARAAAVREAREEAGLDLSRCLAGVLRPLDNPAGA